MLGDVMDRWAAAINAGSPQEIAEVFAEDAVFQGLRPFSVGRQGIAEYYGAQPAGMTVSYRILESRSPATNVVLGYLNADFAFPDRPTINLFIGIAVSRDDDSWHIAQYQASRVK